MRDERHEHQPTGPLSGLVTRATGYRHAGHPAGVHVGMPSCSLTMVIPFDAPLTLSGVAEPGAGTDFTAVVAGLHARPTYIHHDGSQHGIQLALRPTAARTLFGCTAAELARDAVELADVLGPAYRVLCERLHEEPTWDRRFAVLEAALAHSLVERTGPAPEVEEAWRLVRRPGPALRVGEIAGRVGWSVRHLQQRFRAEFGITPKEASRIWRFQRSVAMVSGRIERLSDVAVRCGYADQAHLDREWRALAGAAPTRWLAGEQLAFVQDPADRTLQGSAS